MKPEIMLFDEPTSALDPEIGRRCVAGNERSCKRRNDNVMCYS